MLPGGSHVEPIVFDGVDNASLLAREVIFGPVPAVIRCSGDEEALAIANDGPYGLQAGVWMRDTDRTLQLARGLLAGTVHVNAHDDDLTVPFGSVRDSGIRLSHSFIMVHRSTVSERGGHV